MDNIYKSGIDTIDELTIKIHDPSISKIYRDELAELRDFRIRDIFKYDNNSSWYEPKLWRLVNEGNIYKLSLDNDLGSGLSEGKEVLKWIEEQAFHNTLKPIPHIIIHSQNPVAVDEMMKARFNAWKSWQNHGYKRIDFI